MVRRRVEWPTVILSVALHVAWGALLIGHHRLSPLPTMAALGILLAWYGSLEHEVLHRHPTSSERVNRWFVALPLALWVPFDRYRETHLAHHRDELTVPGVDPESFHVTPERWATFGPTRRAFHWANRTLLGRITLGPVWNVATFWSSEARLLRSDAIVRRMWADHVVRATAVVTLVVWSGIPWWEYLLGAVYLGTALTMVRSFAEHCITNPRDHTLSPIERRTAVVRSNGPLAWLYLHNNLHVTHHGSPGVPWYRLPGLHRSTDADAIAQASGAWYRSYWQVAARYLVRPYCQPVHAGLEQRRV